MPGDIVSNYLKMWPRSIFDIFDRTAKRKLHAKSLEILQNHGVYVLFRDDKPYDVGQARKRKLFDRLHDHANKATDKYYNFWNFFSAFVVNGERHINEVEAILIAVMPTVNAANPKLKPENLPQDVRDKLTILRRKAAGFSD